MMPGVLVGRVSARVGQQCELWALRQAVCCGVGGGAVFARPCCQCPKGAVATACGVWTLVPSQPWVVCWAGCCVCEPAVPLAGGEPAMCPPARVPRQMPKPRLRVCCEVILASIVSACGMLPACAPLECGVQSPFPPTVPPTQLCPGCADRYCHGNSLFFEI